MPDREITQYRVLGSFYLIGFPDIAFDRYLEIPVNVTDISRPHVTSSAFSRLLEDLEAIRQ